MTRLNKSKLWGIAFVAAMFAVPAWAQKIGVVEYSRLVDESPQAKAAVEQRTRAEKDLRDGARDLQQKRAEVQDDFNARRNEEMSRLQRVIIEEVRTYAKAQNFDLVIADGAIYAAPSMDITAAILASLQAKAPKPAAGGAAAPKPPTTPAK